jgi:hypothetical protein
MSRSHSTAYHKSKNKLIKITCRVESCKAQILQQNYRVHIREKHPEEDEKDLRVYGQHRLQFGLPGRDRDRPGKSGDGDLVGGEGGGQAGGEGGQAGGEGVEEEGGGGSGRKGK